MGLTLIQSLFGLAVIFGSGKFTASMPITLYAPFNSHGLRGNITFTQERAGGGSFISIHLTSSNVQPTNGTTMMEQYQWSIHTHPVFYDARTACHRGELGKQLNDMSAKFGNIQIPTIDGKVQTFHDFDLSLEGVKTIWGRSILLRNLISTSEDGNICTNTFSGGDVKTAEALFTKPIAGNVVFRENENGETLVYGNLFNVGDDYKPSSQHEWKILVADILDTRRGEKCNYLSILLDPSNTDDGNCSTSNHELCKMGDMTRKHGLITVGTSNNRYSKSSYVDKNLELTILSGTRPAFLVIYEKGNLNKVLGCARINIIEPREVKSLVQMKGVSGYVRFSQRYKMDPTIVTVDLKNLNNRGKFYHIHEFPLPDRVANASDLCSSHSVGGHFNPFGVEMANSPPLGVGTNDQYEVGDLSGKYGPFIDSDDGSHFGIYVDMNLPLFGMNSIVGRSVVIHNHKGERWACAGIGYPGPVTTAAATFYYPVAGQIVFRQLRDEPWSETTVLAELSYSDGSLNDTENHAWHVHVHAPGRDFYNYSRRCESVGDHYNPHNVGLSRNYNHCTPDNPWRCEIGDLTSKSSRLKIAAYKGSSSNKLFYTDVALSLSGSESVVGRSIVVHDDFGPKQRGNRLACTPIKYVHPIMATVRNWLTASGIESNVSGTITFYQETSFDETSVATDIRGLNQLASGYHVHKVWVPRENAFPCSDDNVYGHYNPLNIDVSIGPLPGHGTDDQYEVGDLSGKYNVLDGLADLKAKQVDTNLPLHGMNGIIGRSVVVHKKEKAFRWACGTIRPEVKKGEGKEVVAVASFDEPRSLVQGFVRFRQFEYNDGSTSDTWIEVDLKHLGERNRNITHDHRFEVYVNSVGEDAFNQVKSVRCISSGYRWNPFFTSSHDKLYKTDCSSLNPFRCEMGDLSGRHGHLSIGKEKYVLTDVNLPLVGNFSVMARSVIIFEKNGGDNRLACANIKPDMHLVSNVAIKLHPSFTVPKFMDHMRSLLKTVPWLVSADIHNTKQVVNGECLQISVNFYGSAAYRLQVEFSNLINLGTIQRSDRFATKAITTFYKPCRTLHELNGNGSRSLRPHRWLLAIFLSASINLVMSLRSIF